MYHILAASYESCTSVSCRVGQVPPLFCSTNLFGCVIFVIILQDGFMEVDLPVRAAAGIRECSGGTSKGASGVSLRDNNMQVCSDYRISGYRTAHDIVCVSIHNKCRGFNIKLVQLCTSYGLKEVIVN